MIKKILGATLLSALLMTNVMAGELTRTVLPYEVSMDNQDRYQLTESGEVYWLGLTNTGSFDFGVYKYDGITTTALVESTTVKHKLMANDAGHAVWREYTDDNQTGNPLQNGRIYFYDGNEVNAISPEGETYVVHALGENSEVIMSGYNKVENTWTMYLYNGTTTVDIGFGFHNILHRDVQVNNRGQVAWQTPYGIDNLSNALFFYDGQSTIKLVDVPRGIPFKLNDLGQIAWSHNDWTNKNFQFNVYINGQIINVVSSATQNIHDFDLKNNGDAFWALGAPWGGDIQQLFAYIDGQIITLNEGSSSLYNVELSENGHILYTYNNNKLVFGSMSLGFKTLLDGQYDSVGFTLLDDGTLFAYLVNPNETLYGHYDPLNNVFIPFVFPELNWDEWNLQAWATTQSHYNARVSLGSLDVFNGSSVLNAFPEGGSSFDPFDIIMNEAGDILIQEYTTTGSQLVLYKMPQP